MLFFRLRDRNIREVEAEILYLRPDAVVEPVAEEASESVPVAVAEELPVEEPEEAETVEPQIPEPVAASAEAEVPVEEPEEAEAVEPEIPEPVAASTEAEPAEPELAEELTAEVEEEVEAPTEEFCEIAFWRGYLKAAFYARAFDDEGFEVAVGESPLFRAQGNGIPDQTDVATAAYKKLIEQLQADGWQPVDGGETWFGATLRRDLVFPDS